MEKTDGFLDWHKQQVDDYVQQRPQYVAFAKRLEKVLADGCKTSFPESVVQSRAKTVPSFAEKVARKFLKEWPKPDFARKKRAVERFSDLCGARVIVQTTDQVEGVCMFIEANFECLEKDVKHERLGDDRVGYRDTHYVIRLRPERAGVLGIGAEELRTLEGLRAELQVRTWAQHAWADPLHDRMYKAPFRHPASTRRTSNMVAALLEESDRVLSDLTNEVDDKIANFAASAKPEDLEQEIEIQKLVLKEESEADKRTRLAMGLARLYAAKGAHRQVVELLDPLVASTKGALRPTLLLQLGVALCALHREGSPDYTRGVCFLEEVCTLLESKEVLYAPNLRTLDGARGRAAWRLAHALSPMRDEGERVASLFQKACGHAPSNPYYLTDMLGFEMRDGRGGNLPAAMLTQLRRGIETCLQHAASRIELPASCFVAGRLALFLAANLRQVDGMGAAEPSKTPWGWGVEALAHMARGIRMALTHECCADPAVLTCEREWIHCLRKAGDIHKEHPYDFAMELLDLGEVVRAGGKPRRAPRARISGPVLMVAGGAALMPVDKQAGASKLLEAALTDFSGTVIGGGTRSGIPGLVGDVADKLAREGKKRFRLMGYRATISKSDAQPHPAYAAPDVVEVGADYSVVQTLQTWADLLASDIRPSQVRVLGLGGGELAKFDYCIGLALGAQVGVVVGSGREADALCQDPLWSRLGNLLPLPDDVATVRAFVAPANPDTASVEPMAAEIHRRYVDKGELPDNLRPWATLDEKFKRSNRHQAAYAVHLLEAAGFEVRKVPVEAVVLASFTPAEIERMAELEHGRWNVERLADGWRLGPRDNENLLRPQLVPWTDLPDKEKQHDRDAVCAFPEILAQQGLEIRRRG